MRIGYFGGTRTKLVKLIAVIAGTLALPAIGNAQFPDNGGYSPGPRQSDQGSGRATQAIYTTPSGPASNTRQSSYIDSFGNPLIVPASYSQCGCADQCGQCGQYGQGGCYGGCNGGGYGGCNGGCYGQGGCGCGGPGAGCGGGFNGCMPMGGGGTDPPNGYELMNDVGSEGNVWDQRGPHYFDIRAEAVWLHRDKTFGDTVDFTALNVGTNVVLSSDQLDASDQIGFRAIGRYDICALSVVEFGYTGLFDFSDSATVTDTSRPGNLYSLFSRPAPGTGNFGINPPTVSTGINPLPFTEQAIQQSISFKSDLQTAEISYRRYWLGWSPRISGTLLGGFRYTKVNEDFEFDSLGSPNTFIVSNPAFEYRTGTENNLSGFQAGGDGWISLTQGLRLGAEVKAGIYDNHYNLQTTIQEGNVGSLSNVITPEKFDGDKVAFIGEASVDLVADITPSISLRAGYEVLTLESLVLAGDNFNTTSPFGNQGTRVPFVDNSGKLTYSGAHAGIEYTW